MENNSKKNLVIELMQECIISSCFFFYDLKFPKYLSMTKWYFLIFFLISLWCMPCHLYLYIKTLNRKFYLSLSKINGEDTFPHCVASIDLFQLILVDATVDSCVVCSWDSSKRPAVIILCLTRTITLRFVSTINMMTWSPQYY